MGADQALQSGPVVLDAIRHIEELERWVRNQGAQPLATKLEVDEKVDVVLKAVKAIISSKSARKDDS